MGEPDSHRLREERYPNDPALEGKQGDWPTKLPAWRIQKLLLASD